MALDYKSAIPLHVQLKDIIEHNVAMGIYKNRIPSERQIMEEFNVSRSTVREAINMLVREGILEKIHGKGTYISLKPLHEWLGNLSSTTDTIKSMGMEPGAKLVTHYITDPPKHIKTTTGLKKAYFIKRIRYADNIPIGIERHYYPIPIGKELITFNLNDATLYDLIENELGIHFAEAKQTIRSGIVLPEDIPYLEVSADSHVLIAERIIKGRDGKIIEFEHANYRGDLYKIDVNLSRKFG